MPWRSYVLALVHFVLAICGFSSKTARVSVTDKDRFQARFGASLLRDSYHAAEGSFLYMSCASGVYFVIIPFVLYAHAL